MTVEEDNRDFLSLFGRSDSIEINRTNVGRLIRLARKNKFSAQLLLERGKLVDEEAASLLRSEAFADEDYRKKWFQVFSLAIKCLRSSKASYAVVKILKDVPYSTMGDVDVLFGDSKDEYLAAESLMASGFKFYNLDILLDHPLKIGATHPRLGNIPVDFYPDLIANRRKIVGEGRIVINRRTTGSFDDVEFSAPSREDEFYINANHAYSHLHLTLGEIMQGLRIVDSPGFDWDYLYNFGSEYGTLDAIYFMSKGVNDYAKDIGNHTIVDKAVLHRLEQATTINRRIRKFFDARRSTYPIYLSRNVGYILSGLYHTKAIFGRASPETILYDFMTHVIAYAGASRSGD